MIAERLDGDGLGLSGVLPGTPQAVSETMRELRAEIAMHFPHHLADGSWEIVLAEVFNNIVEHAYGGGLSGDIRYRLAIHEDDVSAEVIDSGHPLPGCAPPPDRQAEIEVPVEHLPEGGFGWHLIHSLTSHVSYDRVGGWNRLCFALGPLAPGHMAPSRANAGG